ncbi:MAG: VOC family protein [Candidatus Binatia bacterium]|jgi:catechol 2,3-dioxygenase-like lactoylglutathione lyase family enzyme
MSAIKIVEMDHIVLNVRDIDRSLQFYIGVLGLEGERVGEFKEGKVGFPSVRINKDTIIDLFPLASGESLKAAAANDVKLEGNLNHFCMVVEKSNFDAALESLKTRGITIREGPVSRWGARGRATSIYFLDPDGNEIEIRAY